MSEWIVILFRVDTSQSFSLSLARGDKALTGTSKYNFTRPFDDKLE
jgi:hypothetical protein